MAWQNYSVHQSCLIGREGFPNRSGACQTGRGAASSRPSVTTFNRPRIAPRTALAYNQALAWLEAKLGAGMWRRDKA